MTAPLGQTGRYWAQKITQILLEPEDKQYHTSLQRLIDKQQELGHWGQGFLFNGLSYTAEGGSMFTGRGRRYPSLASELVPEMTKLQAHWDRVEIDRVRIQQELYRLLRPCVHDRDIRDALPETVVELIPELQHIHRLREPAWTLEEEPQDLARFQKFLPKIEMYCSLRYLY